MEAFQNLPKWGGKKLDWAGLYYRQARRRACTSQVARQRPTRRIGTDATIDEDSPKRLNGRSSAPLHQDLHVRLIDRLLGRSLVRCKVSLQYTLWGYNLLSCNTWTRIGHPNLLLKYNITVTTPFVVYLLYFFLRHIAIALSRHKNLMSPSSYRSIQPLLSSATHQSFLGRIHMPP